MEIHCQLVSYGMMRLLRVIKFGVGIGTAETHRDDSGYDDPLAWEVFYDFSMNDSVTVTPAIFVIEKDGKDDVNGALVKTSFKF